MRTNDDCRNGELEVLHVKALPAAGLNRGVNDNAPFIHFGTTSLLQANFFESPPQRRGVVSIFWLAVWRETGIFLIAKRSAQLRDYGTVHFLSLFEQKKEFHALLTWESRAIEQDLSPQRTDFSQIPQ